MVLHPVCVCMWCSYDGYVCVLVWVYVSVCTYVMVLQRQMMVLHPVCVCR